MAFLYGWPNDALSGGSSMAVVASCRGGSSVALASCRIVAEAEIKKFRKTLRAHN